MHGHRPAERLLVTQGMEMAEGHGQDGEVVRERNLMQFSEEKSASGRSNPT